MYPSFIILARFFHYYKDKALKISALRKEIELGINLIDTVEVYKSENLVSEAICDSRRDKLLIENEGPAYTPNIMMVF